MKILITLLNYQNLTGSELYTFELARELSKTNEVAIVSNCFGEDPGKNLIAQKSHELGIKIWDWKMFDPSMFQPDVIHAQQYEPTQKIIALYPDVPVVATVHSIFPVEQPFITDQIFKFIAVKPAVEQKLVDELGIYPEKVELIDIPVDFSRFNKDPLPEEFSKWVENNKPKDKKLVVSAMTVDWLRRKSIMDMIHTSLEENFELWIVGAKSEPYLDWYVPENVKWVEPVWDVEKYLKIADETAGVELGKMTIESWACGKPSTVYYVDYGGNISEVKKFLPPADMEKYDSRVVAMQIEEIYKQAIKEKTKV